MLTQGELKNQRERNLCLFISVNGVMCNDPTCVSGLLKIKGDKFVSFLRCSFFLRRSMRKAKNHVSVSHTSEERE